MSSSVLSYLRHLLPTAGAYLADAELLHRFASTREEAAFTELLRRHGPLVWGVCRRVLGDAHAAEDAFQATFLQLARRAGTLTGDRSLCGWLHTVATRLAGRAWRAEERRRRRERVRVSPMPMPADDLTWRELRQMLDAEIARLPELYRQPLILCYLENQTRSEAAHCLGLAPAVLRGRLERGRQKLRSRLEKLGLPLAAALLLTNADAVPAALSEATRKMVMRVLAGAPAPSAVAALMTGGTLLWRLKIGVMAVILLIAGGIGMGGARREPQPPAATLPAREEPAQARGGVDALGDPLPPGAIRRLGTRRHRIQSWPLPWQSLPDGKSYLALHGVRRYEIRRLDSLTGRILETWPVPDRQHVAGFSPDGRYALMNRVFMPFDGARVQGHKETQEWMLTLYDLAKRKAVWENRENLEEKDWKQVFWTRFSADGRWIATTGGIGEGPVRLWDGATGKELWEHKPDVAHTVPLGFAEGGATLVLRAIDDNSIRLLDRATGKQRRSFPTMDFRTTQQYDLSPDGSAVLFGTYGPSIRLWDVATGKERPALDGHKKWARCFAFSPDGKTLITGGNDPFVLVRAWPSGRIVRTIELGRGNVERMAVSGDGRRVEVLFWGEQMLHFYDLKTGKGSPAPQEGHKAAVYGVALAPEGTLLSFGRDATVRAWNPRKGELVGQLPVGQDLDESGFAVSRDGRLLAASDSGDEAVWLYERATGKRIRKFPAGRARGRQLVFSPDGHWLAAAETSNCRIMVWDATDGRVMLQLKDKVDDYVACAFSPDGRQFAASDHDRVRFWDVGSWKERQGLRAYAPLGLAYSPDGHTLAAASAKDVRLFEVATRRERAHLTADAPPSGSLRFSSTGHWLAWTSSLWRIHVWDARRGEFLGSFQGQEDHLVTDLAFTADDRALVSSSQDSTLLVWDLAAVAAKKPPRESGDVETAWRTLLGDDAKAAYEAIRVLDSSPDAAVKLLARHLKPVATMDTKGIEAWLRDLDSDDFAARERATRELERLGEQAVPALERFLAGKPSLEARRRVELVLGKSSDSTPERLRQMRALEALEWIGNDDARRLLEALAKGATDARLTRDARSSLGRMRNSGWRSRH